MKLYGESSWKEESSTSELKPGKNWVIKPDLIPATYNRNLGIRHFIAFLDLRSNKMYGHIKNRKRGRELLQFLKYIRSLYRGKLYIIIDNLSPHKKIECHFTALRKFAIRNSNYQNHKELGSAIRRYLIWRNKNHEDKRIKLIENQVNFL